MFHLFLAATELAKAAPAEEPEVAACGTGVVVWLGVALAVVVAAILARAVYVIAAQFSQP